MASFYRAAGGIKLDLGRMSFWDVCPKNDDTFPGRNLAANSEGWEFKANR
jgi:hypothetical protein